jgi:hypothetical protein
VVIEVEIPHSDLISMDGRHVSQGSSDWLGLAARS